MTHTLRGNNIRGSRKRQNNEDIVTTPVEGSPAPLSPERERERKEERTWKNNSAKEVCRICLRESVYMLQCSSTTDVATASRNGEMSAVDSGH